MIHKYLVLTSNNTKQYKLPTKTDSDYYCTHYVWQKRFGRRGKVNFKSGASLWENPKYTPVIRAQCTLV